MLNARPRGRLVGLALVAMIGACDDKGTGEDGPAQDAGDDAATGGADAAPDPADAAPDPADAAPDPIDAAPDAAPPVLRRLTVTASAGGKVTSEPAGIDCGGGATACTLDVADGSEVVLTAAPEAMHSLAAWSLDCAGQAAPGPASVTLDADRACRATFLATSGQLELVPPPISVVPGATESNTSLLAFVEQQGHVLAAPLPFDSHVPGVYTQSPPVGGSIPAGTAVDVYFVHLDPVGTGALARDAVLTFPSEIIAVIHDTATLDATDPMVGAPGVVYPGAGGHPDRQLELGPEDQLTFGDDRRTLTLHATTSTSVDQLRVITTTGGPTPQVATDNLVLGPVASVAKGATESSTVVRLFAEPVITLAAALDVDLLAPGSYASAPAGGQLAAGTAVAPFFLHFDPAGTAIVTVQASITFTRPIAAVIVLAAELDGSDVVLAAPGTTYPAAGDVNRGIDFASGDRVTWAGDGRSLRVSLSADVNTDQLRVLLVP